MSDDLTRRSLTEEAEILSKQVRDLKNVAKQRLKELTEERENLDNSEKQEKLQQVYAEFLRQHEIYYVASEHLYIQYFPDTGKWERLLPQALQTQYSIRGRSFDAFDKAMHTLGRKKMSVECSFFPKPDRVLNLMRRDHWLKPQEGEPHYGFKLLLMSLGNGKQENIDHLEQVVYWKYTHPEEYRLPCLVIYGEGGAGKNTFVKEVLGTIFGHHQVLVADAEKTLGGFNGLIEGKTVVMIDEAVADRINSERLKRTVGNRTIDLNPKYGKQGEHDNTPLYLCGGNDTTGAILLAGDATDRRWSILKVEKSIIQRLADDKGIAFEAALKEYDRIKRVFTDRGEVSKWLNAIVQRWQHLENAPVGLHSDDYRQLLETQKAPFEDLMELVFKRDSFTHIEGQTLYEMYKLYLQETNPAARGATKRNTFYQQVRDWQKRNRTGVEWGKIKISGRTATVDITTAQAFYRNSGRTLFPDNREDYLPTAGAPYWRRLPVESRLKLANPIEAAFGEEPKLAEAEGSSATRKQRFTSSA